MNEIQSKTKIKLPTTKNFGIVFSIVFFSISFWPILHGYSFNIYLFIIGLIFLIITYTKPTLFITPNKLWFKFGLFLGSIISPIVMLFIYVLTFIPTKFYFLITNKDPLCIKNIKVESYWVKRERKIQPMNKQF